MKMKNFWKKYIRLEAIPGSNIHRCIGEAVLIAYQEDNTVKFEFNGISYTVNPEEVNSFILLQSGGKFENCK